MPLLHIVVLALVQGITEFLPISSSGHLVMVWHGLDMAGMDVPQQTAEDRLVLDIAVHVGTLFAVCLYFWRDIWHMVLGLFRLVTGRRDPGATLALYVLLGTIPLGLVGYFFRHDISRHLHNIEVVAWATIIFGVVLYISDRIGMTVRRVEHMTVGAVLAIGICQVLALIPGTSRSGITMTAARFLGFERAEAARFSMLLAIPAIILPGLLAGSELYASGQAALGLEAAIAAGIAFVFAFISIFALIGWLRRSSFTPFVVYRLVLGAALLIWINGGV